MSAEQLQSALISLVRYPEHHRGEHLDDFLGGFDLTTAERWQVRALATSHYVSKFGKDQRDIRFDKSVRSAVPLTVKIIGDEIAGRKIFSEKFEPSHPKLGVFDIGRAFLDYFLANEVSLRKEFGFPDFVRDLILYEFTEFVTFGNFSLVNWKVPEDSLLVPGVPFAIIDLKYDIPAFVERAKGLEDREIQALVPSEKPGIILFVKVPKPSEEGTFLAHQFEIDDELKRFLNFQLTPSASDAPALPPCYGDLVSLGLCRPLL